MNDGNEIVNKIPDKLPVIALRNFVVYPFLVLPISISEKKDIDVINLALKGDKMLAVFTVKENAGENFSIPEDIYNVGTAVTIAKMIRMPDESMKVLLQGVKRIQFESMDDDKIRGKIKVLENQLESSEEFEALKRNITSLFIQIVKMASYIPDDIGLIVESIDEPSRLCDFIASNINLKVENRVDILRETNVKKRMMLLMDFLQKELNILKLGEKLRSEVSSELSKEQREYYLREQLKAIQKELGEKDERTMEIEELRKKVDKKKLPAEARERALKEIEKLEKIPLQAADYYVTVNYIEWILDLPWQEETKDNIDIKKAAEILEEDHYDLEKIKDRILEFLAVRKLKNSSMGTILCFVGPPGVGKTSLGKSIARALNRKFIRLALGGVRDEAEIRGHRRTYVGALPGRVLQEMRRVRTSNPVFMIDEIDKIGMDYRGDPTSALLEVLDPEQNNSFVDHFIEIPFDLSHVFFITTANVIGTIPEPLRDRMEIIRLAGYTVDEKMHIAKRYLIPRQIKSNGMEKRKLHFTDSSIRMIVESYTREAGVRTLERTIGGVIRKIAKDITMGKRAPRKITEKVVEKYLGKPVFTPVLAKKKPSPGVVTGMAWTPVGGEILFIEVTRMSGTGRYILTGQLGDVMKESCEIALSYVRANAEKYGIDKDFHKNSDIHIHVPEGAVPKDGPSAGVAIVTSIISLLTDSPARPDISMTGEITLKGEVLPIGGVKEKVLGANRAGIKEIILPKDNEKDIEDVPETVRKTTKFHFVTNVDDVIKRVLLRNKRRKK